MNIQFGNVGVCVGGYTKESLYALLEEHKLEGYFIQSTRGDLKTTLEEDYIYVSIIKYPIRYSIDKLDFVVACQLLKSNQTDELIAHLNKYCKEYK